MSVQHLLEPRSVAIVGASADPKKISGMILSFLQKSGYAGKVYAVNPRYAGDGGGLWYASVEDLPETVDLLVCVVPVAQAFEPIEAAARRGVPCCLLMTGGFGEGRTGDAGRERLARLERICAESGMRVVGPNTVGMVNFRTRMPLTFADWYTRDTGCRGGVAVVTHSGSVGGLVFSSLQRHHIGVDYWIGLGNEASLEASDFIEHFARTEGMHTVVCYLEGIRDGQRFVRAVTEARSRGLRVVVLLAGSTPESSRSTQSHTGKRLSDRDVYEGIFRQCGIVQVRSLSELAYAMVLLRSCADKLGPRIGILSASGGACSVIADHVVDAGLQLPQLDATLQAALDQAIPEYGSSANPVDLSADVIARADILHGSLGALQATDQIDVWLAFGRPLVERYHQTLAEFAARSPAAMVVTCQVPPPADIQESLQAQGIAVLDDPALCLQALARIVGDHSEVASDTDEVGIVMQTWTDPDFGAVVSFAADTRLPRPVRCVRALPLDAAQVEDALQELRQRTGGMVSASAATASLALTTLGRLGASGTAVIAAQGPAHAG